MGAGIALECRLRYPEMYGKYLELCKSKLIEPGILWLYKDPISGRQVLNFPTKNDWKHPSKEQYLHLGLKKFVSFYNQKNIESIAFPILGSDKGGLDPNISLDIMQLYLRDLPIDIEIYRYDPKSKDDLYEETKMWLLSHRPDEISKLTKVKKQYVEKIINAINLDEITQINQLGKINGIGVKTLEKIFRFHVYENKKEPYQLSLF